jgi:hypothetical protein
MSLRMPTEHGAWGLLAVPFFSAAAVAGVRSLEEAVPLALAAIAILSLFLLRGSLEGVASRRAVFEPVHLALAAAGVASGLAVVLLYERYLLLALAASAAVLYLVQRLLVQQHEESKSLDAEEKIRRQEKRSLEAELVGVVVLSHAAPAAWIAVRGQLDRTGGEVWVLNLFFFLGGVLYVKYRVRGLQAHRSFTTLRERLVFAWPVFLYHLALAAFLAAWVLVESRSMMLIVAFVPGILRACQLAVHLGQRFPIRRLGWNEVIHAVLFAALLVLAFRTAG